MKKYITKTWVPTFALLLLAEPSFAAYADHDQPSPSKSTVIDPTARIRYALSRPGKYDDVPSSMRNLIKLCKDLKKPVRAVDACTVLLHATGDNTALKAIILVDRANAQARMRKFRSAINDLDSAIEINPNFYQAYFFRGSVRSRMNDHKMAIADYTQAINLKPDFYSAFFNRGTAFGRMGQLDESIADFTAAISINPNSASAFTNRGTAYVKTNRITQALDDYGTAIRINPKLATVFFNRAALYQRLGRFDEAVSDYVSALNLKGAKQIERLQENLAKYAHYSGQINGTLNEETKNALKSCLSTHRRDEHPL